jgi:tetratricopeptide (TPR) repeat protein
MDMKDLQNAQQSFNRALQGDPNNVPALIGTGLIAHKNGDLPLAIREYTKAVSLKPNDLGYALLARALEQSGRTSDANAANAAAQKISPDMQSTRSAVDHLLAN